MCIVMFSLFHSFQKREHLPIVIFSQRASRQWKRSAVSAHRVRAGDCCVYVESAHVYVSLESVTVCGCFVDSVWLSLSLSIYLSIYSIFSRLLTVVLCVLSHCVYHIPVYMCPLCALDFSFS